MPTINGVTSGSTPEVGQGVNARYADIAKHLQGPSYNLQVDIFDPWIDTAEAMHEYGLSCLRELPQAGSAEAVYAAIVLAVGHEQFVEFGEAGIQLPGQPGAVLFDVKSSLPGRVPRPRAATHADMTSPAMS